MLGKPDGGLGWVGGLRNWCVRIQVYWAEESSFVPSCRPSSAGISNHNPLHLPRLSLVQHRFSGQFRVSFFLFAFIFSLHFSGHGIFSHIFSTFRLGVFKMVSWFVSSSSLLAYLLVVCLPFWLASLVPFSPILLFLACFIICIVAYLSSFLLYLDLFSEIVRLVIQLTDRR